MEKHPVDVHVGARIRHRRHMTGMTQEQLAAAVGIKFQQIQKYESGANRCSASRLYDIARAMDIPVEWFFRGLDGGDAVADVGEPYDERAVRTAFRIAQRRQDQRRVIETLLSAMEQADGAISS